MHGWDELWRLLRGLLTDGERRGRIITIAPADRSRPPSGLRRDERLYVYKRAGMPADGAARRSGRGSSARAPCTRAPRVRPHEGVRRMGGSLGVRKAASV